MVAIVSGLRPFRQRTRARVTLHPAARRRRPAPKAEFLAGTDILGRDVLSRVIHGAWTALVGPIVVAVGAFAIATLLGLLSGYLGGFVDTAVMRWVDFMFALPGPLVAIVVVGVVGGGYWTAVLVLIILFTAPDTRIVRSAVLKQRPLPYIDAARALGVSKTRILFVHILPNILPLILAYVVLDFAFALVNLAGLSFLGLGVEPGRPTGAACCSRTATILFSNPVALLLAGRHDHPDRRQHEPDRRLAVRAADQVSGRSRLQGDAPLLVAEGLSVAAGGPHHHLSCRSRTWRAARRSASSGNRFGQVA